MKDYSEKKYILIIIMYLIVVIEHFLIEKGVNFSYGKDGGLIFRISTICFLGMFYYVFGIKKLSNFVIFNAFFGFVISLLICYLVFFKINNFLGEIINNEMGGLNVSLIYHMLISLTIIIITSTILTKFQEDPDK